MSSSEGPNGFTVLIVDDDPAVARLLQDMLEGTCRVRLANSGLEALVAVQEVAPDLMLLDIEMPDMDGFEVCRQIRDMPELAHLPIIFITTHDDDEREIAGLALDAVDFISKPPRPARVLARVRQVMRMTTLAASLRKASFTDGLCRVANRRYFDESLSREWLRSLRSAVPLAVLMADIDHFRRYNNHLGHKAGDRCLQAVAQTLSLALLRAPDLVARYGGDRFMVLLPDTDATGGQDVARRLLVAVDELRLPHPSSPVSACVTVSVGVTAYDASCDAWNASPSTSRFASPEGQAMREDLIAATDQALHAAKSAGRHRTCFLKVDDLGVLARANGLTEGHGR